MWFLLTLIFVIVSGIISDHICNYDNSVDLLNPLYRPYINRIEKTNILSDKQNNILRGCLCIENKCSRKCCPPGEAYHLGKRVCVKTSIEFNPPVSEEGSDVEIKGFNVTKEFLFMYGKMVCSKKDGESRLPVYPAVDQFYLKKDGNLFVRIPDSIPNIMIYGPDKYCIDTFVSEDEKPHLNALICFISKAEKGNYGLSSSCMLISCFFILLTVGVYAWVPELRNLHGLVLMAYLLSFFVGFLFLATMQILILREQITQIICTSFTFIVYFALLSAFFWLNVMCYDIWWTFSGKRAHGRDRSPGKRFSFYAIYAFGVPTALTILLAALEFSDLPMQHALLPRLRLQGCFIYGYSKLLYLYGPIVLLCVANMTFFALTAFKIWKIKKETSAALRNNDSSTNDQNSKDTQRFTLYIKLFSVMGISWILEVVSSFYPDADFFWQFSDAYNVLVGLIIFIIFVCKKKTLQLIKKSYKRMRGLPLSRTQTTTSTSTRTLSQSRDEVQMNSIKK